VGLCSSTQTASGSTGSIEIFTEKVSKKETYPSDIGQIFAAPQAKGVAVLSQEQYSFDLDGDQCIMAQSYRMSVYPCKGIRNSWN
jgi:hypothetical protein